jgi:hypothetical protein
MSEVARAQSQLRPVTNIIVAKMVHRREHSKFKLRLMCRVAAGAAQPPVYRYFELPNFVELRAFPNLATCGSPGNRVRRYYFLASWTARVAHTYAVSFPPRKISFAASFSARLWYLWSQIIKLGHECNHFWLRPIWCTAVSGWTSSSLS